MNTPQFQSCIDACYACAAACDRCAASCLQEDDPKMMARCIALDMDCAQICRTAAGFAARGSELLAMVCKTCEETCEACANECRQHTMAHCQQCAEACMRCAAECRAIAGGLPGWKQQQAMGAAAH
jgi:hypothetical protein